MFKAFPKVRVLFLLSYSSERGANLDSDFEMVNRALDETNSRDRVHLEPYPVPTRADLIHRLANSKIDVLHFSGHGRRGGSLVLSTSDGSADELTHQDLINLLRGLGAQVPKLIVLTACHSLASARSAAVFCECCVGVPSVFDDSDAPRFIHAFYSALFGRRSVRAALDFGLAALSNQSFDGRERPWLATHADVDPDDFFLFSPATVAAQGVLDLLDLGMYREALAQLETLQRASPKSGQWLYYSALAELGGRRPAGLILDHVHRLENRLRQALALSGGDEPWRNATLAFLAWVKEDYSSKNALHLQMPTEVGALLAQIRPEILGTRSELTRLIRLVPFEARGGLVNRWINQFLMATMDQGETR